MNTCFFDTFSTPFGDFSAAVDPAGAIVATAFGGEAQLRTRLRGGASPTGRLVAGLAEAGPGSATPATFARGVNSELHPSHVPALVLEPSRLTAARHQLLAYFAGSRTSFSLPLAPSGTAFQQQVWAALRAIPFGETRTYGQLAAELGRPRAARAVGRANATNPICVIVPCHRIIGADGRLTGFAFGEELKRRLLDLERSAARTAA